jgi:hypothetical protein
MFGSTVIVGIPRNKLAIRRKALPYSGATLYNSLPLEIRNSSSVASFKISPNISILFRNSLNVVICNLLYIYHISFFFTRYLIYLFVC